VDASCSGKLISKDGAPANFVFDSTLVARKKSSDSEPRSSHFIELSQETSKLHRGFEIEVNDRTIQNAWSTKRTLQVHFIWDQCFWNGYNTLQDAVVWLGRCQTF
jgi:hypothetical protein